MGGLEVASAELAQHKRQLGWLPLLLTRLGFLSLALLELPVDDVFEQLGANVRSDPLQRVRGREQAHVVWDADQHHLRHVDHHEDQDLVAACEQGAVNADLDPHVVVVAVERVDGGGGLIHLERAYEDHNQGDGAERKVGEKQYFGLLLKQILVVVEAIDMDGWDPAPVDQVVFPVKDQIEDLSGQNEGAHAQERLRVQSVIAIARVVGTDAQSNEEEMEANPATLVQNVSLARLVVICAAQTTVHHEAEC